MNRATLYVIGQFVLFGVLALALIGFPPGQTPLLRLIGFVMIGIGFVVVGLGVREYRAKNATLPNVTPTPKAQAVLVDSGVYAHIRHPLYASALLGAFGVALAHGHIAVFAVALVMAVFFTFKSMYEEQLLRAIYPDYGDYMTRTGRFLPFL